MKTLNLVDLNRSDVKYKISKFPDGQQNIIIESLFCSLFEGSAPILLKDFYGGIQIKSRLNNFKDLELIICATKSLRNLGVKDISLFTPYFLGSRSDRKFEEGGNNYLKDIICPIINSLEFSSVTVLDPHSYVLEACLNNFKIESLGDFYDSCYDDMNSKDLVVVCPDAGAQKRAQLAANQMRLDTVITCSKERAKNGGISNYSVPYLGDDNIGKDINYVIVDDICDGGATFINVATELQKRRGKNTKIYLIVTHGIFSKGFGELQQYFDGIYTTNSYQDLQVEPFVKQFKII